jgi:hypothetical protein
MNFGIPLTGGWRKSNIQKAISIQIKNPSSFLSTVAYRSESYFVGAEYS